ncbi:MAG: penicillin-binding protein 1C [Chloroflexota bacterium]
MSLVGRSRAFRARSTGARAIVALSVAFTVLFLLALAAGTAVAAVAYISYRLPSVEIAAKRQSFQSTFIYDRKGRLLYELMDPNGGRRRVVRLEDISPHLIDATIATEDATFYTNPGVDASALVRAIWQNVSSGEIASGASTITMQVIRNVILSPDERYELSLTRKIKESILAYQLSQRYTKNEILAIYLNEINYGNLCYGVEAAAQGYFGKSAKDLTLAEAALLAGLPQSPADYNPLEHPDAAIQRQSHVLALMVKHGYITAEQAEVARGEKLSFQPQKFDIKAPHFTFYVRDLLVKRFGPEAVYQRGLRVYTTIDLDLLEVAEKAAREHIAKIKSLNANNAAVVAIDPKTAEVLVMMGSIDYYDQTIQGQVNMAVSPRQPGSALKPFAYATAFEKGILMPDSVIVDQPTTFPGRQGSPPYAPRNHDLKWHGPVTIRNALACSLNVPAVMVLDRIGIASFLDTLHNMGITGLAGPASQYGLSIVLGGAEVSLLDVTFAYVPFANKGVQVGARVPLQERKAGLRDYEPVVILKVTDAQGEVLYEHQPSPGKQVIRPETAHLITSILSDDKAREGTYGRHSFLELSRPAAAKTGTTEFYQDGWTVGYTPDLVTGVWVGNANNEPMRGVYGVSGAGYIWHNFMEEALKDKPKLEFPKSDGLVQVTVCTETGLLPSPSCQVRVVEFIRDLVPKTTCRGHATPTPAPTPTTPLGAPPPSGTPKARVVVPNVVGMPEAEARKVIEALHLRTTYTNWQTADDVPDKNYYYSVPVGCILSQQPNPGSTVDTWTIVYLAARKD